MSEWWRRGAVHQVYPRSFADGDGDGVGDLRGLRAHLDHLAELSVAVWLSPVDAGPDVLAWVREDGDDRLLAAVNLGSGSSALPVDGEATLLVSIDPGRPSSAAHDLVLLPDEAVLLRLDGG